MSYTPADTVLPEYTDEALTAERVYKGEAAKALLRVPAEYRQPTEVEVTRRSTKTRYDGGMAVRDRIADPHQTRLQVVDEVLAQIGDAP